jgi:hypothetical protein
MSDAINLYFQQKSTFDGNLDLDALIKIASNLQNSYRNFLEINLLKKSEIKDLNLIQKYLKDKDKLVITDVKHGSFDITLSPVKTINTTQDLFENTFSTDDYILEYFNKFNEIVISNNYSDIKNINTLYTEQERRQIWGKFYHIFNDDIEVSIKNQEKIIQINKPSSDIVKLILPDENIKNKTPSSEKKYAVVYAEINSPSVLDKKNIKKVYSINPKFSTDIIRFDDCVFILSSKLYFSFKVEDNIFIIENEYLNFSAWGETEEQAKEAIYFSFYALYKNYYLEEDERLTQKALDLKSKLKNLIVKIIDLKK